MGNLAMYKRRGESLLYTNMIIYLFYTYKSSNLTLDQLIENTELHPLTAP
jgi:hypothetical protein